MSVKDISAFTSKNSSLYLGSLEPCYDYPTILDYIKSLNVSHIQLLPINDFGSVSDEDLSTYNWGYDPISYFALEGSYSKNPADPYLRVKELSKKYKNIEVYQKENEDSISKTSRMRFNVMPTITTS